MPRVLWQGQTDGANLRVVVSSSAWMGPLPMGAAADDPSDAKHDMPQLLPCLRRLTAVAGRIVAGSSIKKSCRRRLICVGLESDAPTIRLKGGGYGCNR